MSATLTITVENASTGLPIAGLTGVKLYYGSSPLVYTGSGIFAGALVGSFTDNGDGSYQITIQKTNQYTVKISGTVDDEYTNRWIVADDAVSTNLLIERGAGTLSAGASLIGVNDPDNRFSGASETVQSVLLELAGVRTSPYTNSNIAALATFRNAITASGPEISALASAGCVQADFIKLHAVTSTAAELNKLDGFTGTFGNLNSLVSLLGSTGGNAIIYVGASTPTDGTIRTPDCAGGTASHLTLMTGKHAGGVRGNLTISTAGVSGGETGGNIYIYSRGTSASNGGDIYIDSSSTGGAGDGGDILLKAQNTGTTGTQGQVKIYNKEQGGSYWEAMSEFHIGTRSFASTNYLSGLSNTTYGVITNALRILDQQINNQYIALSGGTLLWKLAKVFHDEIATGDIGGTTLADAVWTHDGSTLEECFHFTLPVTELGMSSVRIRLMYKIASGGSGGHVKFQIGDGSVYYAEQTKLTSTTDSNISLTLTPGVSFSSPQVFSLWICDDNNTHTLSVYRKSVIVEYI